MRGGRGGRARGGGDGDGDDSPRNTDGSKRKKVHMDIDSSGSMVRMARTSVKVSAAAKQTFPHLVQWWLG